MTHLSERTRIAKQVKSYYYIDGTGQIETGLILIFIVIVMFILQNGFLASIVGAITVLIVSLFRNLRKRITSQRTGFVDFKDNEILAKDYRFIVIVGLGLFVSFCLYLVFTFFVSIPLGLFLSIGLFGSIIIYSISTISIGYRAAMPRFYFSGALSLVLGICLLIYFLNQGIFSNLAISEVNAFVLSYGVGVGLTDFLLGLVTLRHYLREYPVIKQVEE